MRLRAWPLFVLPFLFACGAGEGPVDSTREPIKVCPDQSQLAGIDVSHWNGTIDWAEVKASGRAFAFAKATEGTTFIDSRFAANWASMKQQGVVRSAYHFFHANMDPIAEADHFLHVMGPLEPGDLPPMLDIEVDDGQSGATITAAAIQWLDYVAQQTGTKPILYTSPSFVTGTLGSPQGLETHALLWIANWGVQCPDVPAPFTSWEFWQHSATGSVPGISGNVDLDVFNGNDADLMGLTVQPPSASSSSSGGIGGEGGGSSSGGGSATSGVGGGDNGLEPGSPGCTCAVPVVDDRSMWRAAASFFAFAFALARRARR